MNPRGLYKDQKAVFVSRLYHGYEGGLALAKQAIKFFKRRPTLTFATGFILLFVVTGFFIVRASFFYLYPKECSGDWQNSQNAAEKPDLEPMAEPTLFTNINSAVLDEGVNKQVVCSGFYGEEVAAKILKVRLVPSWVFMPKDVALSGASAELPNQPSSDLPPISPDGSQDLMIPEGDQLQVSPPDGSQTPPPETSPADEPPASPPETPPAEEPLVPASDTPPALDDVDSGLSNAAE